MWLILNAQHFLEFQVLKPFGPELLGFGQQNLIEPECLSEGQVYRKIFLLLGFWGLYQIPICYFESGKRNYCFGKKSGKSLEFWIQNLYKPSYL